MSTAKTYPNAAQGAAAEQSADGVLATAAATAKPGAQPQVEGQPPEVAGQAPTDAASPSGSEPQQGGPLFTDQGSNNLTTDEKLPPKYPAIQPVYSLERARALPELQQDAYVPFECDDPAAILAFKELDGRTMRVAVALDCLAKIEVRREPLA